MDQLLQSASAFLEDEIITITIDESSTTFKVSKILLYRASDYFRKALEGSFVEAATRTLRLPGYDEDVVRMLLYYLYNASLPDFLAQSDKILDTNEQDIGDKKVVEFVNKAIHLLISLWQFADEHLMPKLQNETMRQVLMLLKENALTAQDIKRCFASTAEGSPLREAFLAEAVTDWKNGKFNVPGAMDALAAILGFFEHFCRKLAACPVTCAHIPVCRPTYGNNWKRYMVKEN